MALRQGLEPALGLRVAVTQPALLHQHHPGGRGKIAKQFLMLLVELEHPLCRRESGHIPVVVQPPHEVQAQPAAVGQVLPLAQGHQRRGHRAVPVAEGHEVHAGIVHHPVPATVLADVGGGAIHPRIAANVRIAFGAGVVKAVHRQLRVQILHEAVLLQLVGLDLLGLETHVFHEAGVPHSACGGVLPGGGLVGALAGFAHTRAIALPTIAGDEGSAHVEEDTVERQGSEQLP